MENVILLTGSNMGNRLLYLSEAMDGISRLVGKITASSSVYESSPWGFSNTANFLNQVIAVETDMEPEDVLNTILSIERSLGRIRHVDIQACEQNCCTIAESLGQNFPDVAGIAVGGQPYQSRTIDIDILFYGQRMVFTERLMIPHPRLHLRRFTLVPLTEILPDYIHPLLKKNVTELAGSCPDLSAVTRVDSTFRKKPG